MTHKLKYRIFAEWNRDGDLNKIETLKYDPEKVSTVAIHEQEQFISESGVKKWKPPVKVFEHIFIRDEEPDGEGKDPVIEFEDSVIEGKPNQPLTIRATITDPDGNDTIKEIVWLQMMGDAAPFVVEDDKKSITVTPSKVGDYTFSCTATDQTDRVATKLCNLRIRDEIPPPPPDDFTPLAAGFGDSNSSSNSNKTFGMISATGAGVAALGDYEYDSDFNDFIAKYGGLKAKTIIAYKGNHDDNESESSSIESANKEFWGWADPAIQKATMSNIGFVSLDTQDADINDKNGSQYQFVEKTLKEFSENPNIDFIIAGCHKPIYCPTSKHGELENVKDTYQPLFDKYGVDLVLHGHNHNAATSYPITLEGQKLFTELEQGVYDFSKAHGQIYIVSGNSGESLYQIDSNPAYIQFSNDNDFGYLLIEVSNKTNKRLRIKHIAHSGQTLHSVIIDKTGEGTTPPPPTCPDPNAHFDTALQKCVCNNGYHDENGTCVKDATTPPPPTGNLIFDSARDTKLQDGIVRTITQEGSLAAGGLGVECRASGNPKIVVNADKTFTLQCNEGHGRIYVYAKNYNSMLELYARMSASVDNLSLKLRSRHNEDGACEIRFGGFGDATDRDVTDFKTESCHNNHENAKDIDFNPNLQTGKWFGIRFECKNINNDKEVQFKSWIDYLDGQGWKEAGTFKHSSPKNFYMDKASFAEQSYFWIRLNGAGTIDLRDVKLIDLDKPAQ